MVKSWLSLAFVANIFILVSSTAPQCPVNEFHSDCIEGNCSPQNCSQVGIPVLCPDVHPKSCTKGCLCKEGYMRNEKGICIPSTECPSCGGDPNQIAGCGIYCNQRCRDVGKEPGACILLCKNNSCDCRKGYFLDENTGFCVFPKQCTYQCPINEWYSECIQGNCSPQKCSQLGFSIPCPRIDPKYCKKGCLCKEGYVRNKKGICIPSKECPSCGGDPNAQSGCGGNCNRHCSDIGKKPGVCTLACEINGCDCKEGYFFDDNIRKCVKPEHCNSQCPVNEWYSKCTQGSCNPQNCSELGLSVPCPDIRDPKYCIKGCLCIEGYVRNNNGICIPSAECPPICLDKNNEVYSDCINGGCEAKNCSQYGKPVACVKIDPKHCIKGCLCKEGYLRAANGNCIPEKKCPEACSGPNEEYNECSWDCPPQTCESLDRAYVCPIIDGNNCKPMCRCISGYFRNKIGQCITEKECRRCLGPREYYSCGGACDNVCATLHEQSQDNCPIINIKCNEMCYCEKDFARAKNNTCIPISSCSV